MRRPILLLAPLALAGCGQAGSDNGADMVSPATNESAQAPANVPAPTAPLLAYQGKYPSEKVEGVAFFDQPLVKAAVARAVGADKTVTADRLLGMDGPETPISYSGGELRAWRCEENNCGPHNWALVISPDGAQARVCYQDDDADSKTLWFKDGVRTENDDDCSTGTARS